MKKALSVFLMAAMAFGAFADEPVADVNVAEFKGEAKVTWGVDLDSGKTGFKNEESASLKLNLLKGGERSTTGDGVWAELVIKTTDANLIDKIGDNVDGWNKVEYNDDDTVNTRDEWRVTVEKAQINFGPAYVGIRKGNITVGELKLDTAVRSERKWLNNVGTNKEHGIVAGFDSDVVKVDLDIRSSEGYSDDYGMAAEVELKAVENLSVKAGVSYAFDSKDVGYAASAGYKLGLNDTFYLRPQVGITGEKGDDPMMAAGVLFGWGDVIDDNAGVYFLNNKLAKKVTPGVSIAASIPLKEDTTIKLQPAFYSGELIPGLTAAAIADFEIPTAENAKGWMGFALGAKYAIGVEAMTITPQAGIAFTEINKENYSAGNKLNTVTDDNEVVNKNSDVLQVKVGVDVAGLINNTTLSAAWTSKDLLANEPLMGTFDISAKIAF